jgi:hypothetical protein
MENYEAPTQPYTPSVTLSITFSGPFLFAFPPSHRNNLVHIFAPYCPYHEAGIFYSNGSQSEIDLWRHALSVDKTLTPADRKYAIEGPGIQANLADPQIISEVNPPASLCGFVAEGAPVNMVRTTLEKIRIDKMLFRLSVPKPEFIFPMYYDCLEVVNGYNTDHPPVLTPHCTGLRFFYRWHPGSRICLRPPAGEMPAITPPVFRDFQNVADIEVRYEGLGLNDENDPHADSRSCFASLAVLAGLEQWLNYGDGKSSPTNPSPSKPHQLRSAELAVRPNLLIHSGGDCHPPIIVAGLD